MSKLQPIEPEYVYVTIPAEYICVYQKILIMLADYGEDMLKDCKASCTDKNAGVIECFNMFNSAVAAKKLGKDKLAEVIIKYIKTKINQIYKGKDNSRSFVFPVDEDGMLKAYVTCGERPKFEINPDDMNLYEYRFGNGFKENFYLGPEDESDGMCNCTTGLRITLSPRIVKIKGIDYLKPNAKIYYDNDEVDIERTKHQFYLDKLPVENVEEITNLSTGEHNIGLKVSYNGETKLKTEWIYYAITG